MAFLDRETLNDIRETSGSVSGVIPLGQSDVRLGYDRSKLTLANGTASTVAQLKATYQYNLSKRTALYTTASLLDNKNATRLTLPGAAGQTSSGGDSKGVEFGVRHFF